MIDPHTGALVGARQRYLEQLELQLAKFGELHAPPYLINDIVQTRAELDRLGQQRTQQILHVSTLTAGSPAPARGLILLVSPRRTTERIEDLASYQAIMYHQRRLEHCWLIATSGEGGSRTTADELALHFQSYGVHCST